VLDTSGYAHRVLETDVYDSHDYIYEKDFVDGLKKFVARHEKTVQGSVFANPMTPPVTGFTASGSAQPQVWSVPYKGQPYFVSEFGGFKWNPDAPVKSAAENQSERKTSWGYGSDPVDVEDFHRRFEAVCDVLLDNPAMFGYCYTQLTDIFPEENGIFDFYRRPKFDIDRIRKVQQRAAAIEQRAD
jgi:hypothetical protein